MGSGVFRNLQVMKRNGKEVGREYRLPSGGQIDVLCEERTRRGKGALVVIELKRDRERGTVEQVIGYLDDLKRSFPSRGVRGIIISGREDQVAAAMLKGVRGYQIDWYCYRVTFERRASTPGMT